MNKSICCFLIVVFIFSCRPLRYVDPYAFNPKGYGKIVMDFGSEHIKTDMIFGSLNLDTVLNKSELVLSMTDFLENNDTLYNIFKLNLYFDTATYQVSLGTYKLNPNDKIRYHVSGSKGVPYYPLDAQVNLTYYDSINPYSFRVSGNFKFTAAKAKYFLKKGDKDFNNARMEYFDSVLVIGRFDTVYYNFFYNSLSVTNGLQSKLDTLRYDDWNRGD